MKVLVTGGCGFIGTNLLRHILENRPDWSVVNFDLLTYAGNLENTLGLQEAYPGRYEFVKGDIADRAGVDALFSRHSFDLVLNLAAESHVDRSIEDASVFMRTNVLGVQVLLDAARKYKVDRFLHVSTDEVYGSLGKEGRFREDLLLAPNSPYSASKAAADLLVRSYVKTYGLDAVIRTVPVSGKADSPDDHQCLERQGTSCVWGRQERERLDLCRRPLPGNRSGSRERTVWRSL